MTDKLKETVSALIDGEASEIEVHRLLRQLESETGLESSWVTYLQVRSIVQGERQVPLTSHLDLHARISRAIEEEPAYDLKSGRRLPPLRVFAKPIAGLAVAASLAAAVTVGYYMQPAAAPGRVATTMPAATPIVAQPVSTDTMPVTRSEGGQPLDLRQLDQEQQRVLRQYLNLHDQMARMDPNTQMVIYENPDANQ